MSSTHRIFLAVFVAFLVIFGCWIIFINLGSTISLRYMSPTKMANRFMDMAVGLSMVVAGMWLWVLQRNIPRIVDNPFE